MGGGGALHSSSKTGFIHAGNAPEGDVQVEVLGGVGGGVGVLGGGGGGAVEDSFSETVCTPLRLITPPMPPTINNTMSFSILANAWSIGAMLLIG